MAEQSVEDKARQFGEELRSTLSNSVECNVEEFDYKVAEIDGLQICTIRSSPQPRIQLCARVGEDGEHVPTFGLELEYKVFFREGYLAVQKSSMTVGLGKAKEPLFRYEYDRGSRSVPTAHLHVHGHRDELIHGMLLGSSGRTTRRLKALQKNGLDATLPTLSQIHFPLGGRRLRPGLEDLLELLITEFGVAPAREDWKSYLATRRRAWRELQLDTLIARNLGRVIEVLDEHGYKVRPMEPAEGAEVSSGDPALEEY